MTSLDAARAALAEFQDINGAALIARAYSLESALRELIAEHERLTADMHQRELHHFETEKLLVEAGLDPDAAPPTDDERERIEQSNEIANIVFDQIKAVWPDLHPVLDLRYGIADAVWGAGLRRQGPITDEWEYGYELLESDTRDVLARGWPFDTSEAAMQHAVARAEEESDPDVLPIIPQVVRRRLAGPWEQVEAARDAS